MLRRLIRWIIRLLFSMFSRVDVQGMENIPDKGGAILALNHVGRLDAPLIFCLLKREKASSLVAKKYQKNLFTRLLINAAGAIWIDRRRPDFRALRQAIDFIRDGGALGIAPEGTRSTSGGLGPAKDGVAYLADKAGAPIIPVGITGTEDVLKQLLRLQRPRISVRFGTPFYLPPIERHQREEALRHNTDEIMCQIAALLPPGYRGVYAGYSRTMQLSKISQNDDGD